LVWIKQQMVLGRCDYHYRHGPILYGRLDNGPHYFCDDRTQDTIFQIDRPVTSEFHPTTKPTQLIAPMIANSTRAGELVYDPFSGSGSMLLAAHQQSGMFSYVSAERRVPRDPPLRAIRVMVDAALKESSWRFDAVYATSGRPSIPPEKLLRALLLQVLYTVRR
jgi:hypothetical protein